MNSSLCVVVVVVVVIQMGDDDIWQTGNGLSLKCKMDAAAGGAGKFNKFFAPGLSLLDFFNSRCT